MKQSPTQQLEEMHATLVRAIASLENHNVMETHRLLAVLRGMIEGALAEAYMAGGGAKTTPLPLPAFHTQG
jgi:hypothetical protein